MENDQRRAAIRFVAERNYRRVLLQQRVDDLALHPDTPPMDDANLTKTSLHRLIQIFFHYDVDFLRLERVQVNGILDWDVVHDESI